MVWLRYELWEDHNGFSYRMGDKAETDRLQVASPEARLSNIFYAPSPAAAEAQYCALRGIGPYIVNTADSEEPFTMAQLERQLTDFPHDERLARQPALPDVDAGHAALAAHEPDHAQGGHDLEAEAHPVAHAAEHHDSADAHASDDIDSNGDHPEDAHAHDDHAVQPPVEAHAAHLEPDPHDGHETAQGEPVESHVHPAADHAHDDHAASVTAAHQPHPGPDPAQASDEPPVSEPVTTSSAALSALGPITLADAGAPVVARKRRKPNGFVGFLRLVIRLVMLVIVLGGVTIGVGVATGNLDAATLLAKARALPMQIRDLPGVQSLLP